MTPNKGVSDHAEGPAASRPGPAAPPCQAALLNGWGNRGLGDPMQPKVVAEPGLEPQCA